MVVEARQSFQFFKQMTWFLRNNGAFSKYRWAIVVLLYLKYRAVPSCVCVCVCIFFDWGYEIEWPSPFFLLSSTSFPHLTFLGTKIIRFLLLFCYLAERNTFNENSSTFCWLTNILINANTYKHTDKCKHLIMSKY